jgi:hypothetical protein
VGQFPSEIRLIATIGASVWVTTSGYRFARRSGGDTIDAMIQGLLVFYLVQYLSVGMTGILGILYWPVMLAVGCALGGVLWLMKDATPLPQLQPRERWALAACLLLVGSYIAGVVWIQRMTPPLANDALTYHLPAAVDWIQQHRLTLYQTWLYNPANTYSPLAGSMFITWLLAPMGNDVLGRFVQIPALLLIFFAMIKIGQNLGARPVIAMSVATIAILSQPLIRQIMLAKDDLFVAAFFTAAVAELSSTPKRGLATSVASVAVSIGLLLATKYTAILSLPLLLLMIDAPSRARWRAQHWISWILVVAILAGPWYLRNLLLTGNPIYPLGSLFSTARSQHLRTLSDIWTALSGTYYSPRPILWLGCVVSWVAVSLRHRGRVVREPLLRTCVLGPIVGIAIFILTSPYNEIRFINPSLILLMACATIAFPGWIEIAWLVLLAAATLATNFSPAALEQLLPVVLPIALVGGVIAFAAVVLLRDRRSKIYAGAVACLLLGGWVYVWWEAYVQSYRDNSTAGWIDERSAYMPLARGWAYVRTEIPADQRLAYANAYFVYPLYGFDLDRRTEYVPLRGNLKNIKDLPRLPGKLTGEQIEPAIVHATISDPDRDVWMKRLRESGATVLFVGKRPLTESPDESPPPELTFAEQDPAHFQLVFNNTEAAVYRISP